VAVCHKNKKTNAVSIPYPPRIFLVSEKLEINGYLLHNSHLMKEALYLGNLRREITRPRLEPIVPHQETLRLRIGAAKITERLDDARRERMDAVFTRLAELRKETDAFEKDGKHGVYLATGIMLLIAFLRNAENAEVIRTGGMMFVMQFMNAGLAALRHQRVAWGAFTRVRDILQEEPETVSGTETSVPSAD
jgi:hypothetical protein